MSKSSEEKLSQPSASQRIKDPYLISSKILEISNSFLYAKKRMSEMWEYVEIFHNFKSSRFWMQTSTEIKDGPGRRSSYN